MESTPVQPAPLRQGRRRPSALPWPRRAAAAERALAERVCRRLHARTTSQEVAWEVGAAGFTGTTPCTGTLCG
eukprot:2625399-Prymnesium_polylepis.1